MVVPNLEAAHHQAIDRVSTKRGGVAELIEFAVVDLDLRGAARGIVDQLDQLPGIGSCGTDDSTSGDRQIQIVLICIDDRLATKVRCATSGWNCIEDDGAISNLDVIVL